LIFTKTRLFFGCSVFIVGLFKSSEDKLKEHISKTYDNYLSILKTVPDDEIGFVLDYAVKIKSSSTLFE